MPSIKDLRKQYPQLDGMSDDDAVDVMHWAFYPDRSRDEVAAAMGVAPLGREQENSAPILGISDDAPTTRTVECNGETGTQDTSPATGT